MPSQQAWKAIEMRTEDGRTLSAIVDELIVSGSELVTEKPA
jgi:hypothetical protein